MYVHHPLKKNHLSCTFSTFSETTKRTRLCKGEAKMSFLQIEPGFFLQPCFGLLYFSIGVGVANQFGVCLFLAVLPIIAGLLY